VGYINSRQIGAKKAWKTGALRGTLRLLIDEYGGKEFDKSVSLVKKRYFKNSR